MAIKRINQSPTIADKIIFDIPTPDAQGCFNSAEYVSRGGPYKVDRVLIYHISIDHNSPNYEEYEKSIYDETAWAEYQEAKNNACDSPTDENLLALTQAQNKLAVTVKKEKIYYRSADVIASFGTEMNPAWLSSDVENSFLLHIDEDADGNPQYGHYELHWEPKNAREGDYFICWTWTPNPAGDSLVAHTHFTLHGNTQLTTSIPSHYTPKNKYETLLERYLPEIYKTSLSDSDVSPQVFHELNLSIAKGFTFLEDMCNQMVDLQDANTIHESLIPYLSNLFNLRLKSDDPTLWRAQVKRAIPLFKKKGTLSGLQEAFVLAGMRLAKFTRLWQVISSYTWQEMFTVTDEDYLTFTLAKTAIIPIDPDNFELYYRLADSEDWIQVNSDYVHLEETDDATTMTWIGHDLSYAPVVLEEGDSIRVVYMHTIVPGHDAQIAEDYIRTLPLSDQRDERDQDCPLKNWNIRLIEEDDPMFDVVIPTRHPYFDSLIYGWVRTEFPYSENIYNMEEYNGSTRESKDPCDIDCSFLDSCKYCQSSKYVVDVEVNKLSDDRIFEIQEILKEFTPFHAVTHAINFTGSIEEYIATPEERVEVLAHAGVDEFTVAGGGQKIFSRTMEQSKEIDRDDLAIQTVAATSMDGTAYNDSVAIYCPDYQFTQVGLDYYDNWLEILAPSVNAGDYSISHPNKHHAEVSGTIGESPLNTKEFTFRLSNKRYAYSPATITVELSLKDSNVDFESLNVKSYYDVNENPHHVDPGDAWKVKISAYSPDAYIVREILPDGSLLLEDHVPSTLPSSEDHPISYTLYNGAGEIKATSSTGEWRKTGRGILDLSDDTVLSGVRDMFHVGDYVLVTSTGSQYQVSGFVYDTTHLLYLASYDGAGTAGINVEIYTRIINGGRGYFQYKGIKLRTVTDYENSLGILNGENAPGDPNLILENDLFKENFLILIGSDYYAVSEWDATTITLNGPYQSWKTLTAGGTTVSFSILKHTKKEADIAERPYLPHPVPGHYFGKMEATGEIWESDKLDRSAHEVIEVSIEEAPSMPYMAHVLNTKKDGGEI